ncbi:5-aminolevulinate synthase [Streptomyces dangxiongensis]|uniref:5-aminolevulinic acid synthase n=1 Tax=Streptomyces dangxiongensis TaxID=1442032 RepID=A0A3G2JAL4_9ACTN|nr:5-aminolevulinate synthase [Streptomyces dangxiongensis]AYN38651.1 5-aminolevulinate synthase [Streptomyces dangxiongensis]
MPTHLEHFTTEVTPAQTPSRTFLEISRQAGNFPTALARVPEGSAEVSVWCSNDYLGMGQHPLVLAAVHDAVAKFGAGSGGSRNIGGTNHRHVELERELADWHGKDAALLFTSGYTANDGALTVLAGTPDDTVVFSDELNHASIIDGLRHSGATKRIFRHNEVEHLAQLLADTDPELPKLIVLESVYSMSGDVAPLAEIAELARRHGATTFLDEVHAIGMYGPEGAGIAAREGIADRFDIIMGTLAKGLGTVGGYIAGPNGLIDYVRATSRAFVFTTSLPPATAAGALAAVRHLRGSELERQRLAENARLLHRLLDDADIPYKSSDSHIVSAVVGDDTLCKQASALLLDRHRIYVQAINAPSVREGDELLRIAPSATHTPTDVKEFAEALAGIWRDLGITTASARRGSSSPVKEVV